MIKPLKKFPFLDNFKKIFPITERTVFAWKGVIYTNYDLPPDILIHEQKHLERQTFPYEWIENYFKYPEFRLQEELIAYKAQIDYWTNREAQNHCRIEAATNLSSPLYGGLISYEDAFKRL